MPNEMDVVGSLKKISRELATINVLGDPDEVQQQIDGAAFLINWIADGLQNELNLAAQRGNALRYKELGS